MLISPFFIFNFLLCLIVIVSIFIVFSINAIQAILQLVLVFMLSGLVSIILGAEFLGFFILIVYVGAVAILFLFVIMLLNIRIVELNDFFFQYLSVSLFLGGFLFSIFFVLLFFDFKDSFYFYDFDLEDEEEFEKILNINLMAYVLYNYTIVITIVITMVLLVALLGSMTLVTNLDTVRSTVTKADAFEQLMGDYSFFRYGNN